MNKEFLKELLETPSVSGYEQGIQQRIAQHMKPYCDELRYDHVDNVIALCNPDAPFKVLLCAHSDEIGFYINRILDNGFVKVIRSGGVQPALFVGTHVQCISTQGVYHGVVVTHRSLTKNADVTPDDLYIDFGFHDKEDALQHVQLGNMICAAETYHDMLHHLFSARAIDDKGGVFIIMEALKRAKAKGVKCGVYAAATTGEETTRRGAYHAAMNVKPDCAIIVDVTFASDYPFASDNEGGDIALGKGPVLCASSTVNPTLNTYLETLAKQASIPVQWEVTPGFTHTDGDTILMSHEGIAIALVSLPLRYMHSSVETASWDDIEHCITLISDFLIAIEQGISFVSKYEQ